ncbi:transmembrane protein 168-like [Protopterus annectens]|uniref:transmembrane protein 168-like n=1 Tax=Protopterus annectens TaxID=7888 RepID=UPI001CFAB66D|nr:transmembrane protein 168-like [Protopterus annectens]
MPPVTNFTSGKQRAFKIRFLEHLRDIKNGKEDSPVAAHFLEAHDKCNEGLKGTILEQVCVSMFSDIDVKTSPDGQPALLPPEHVQELNLRSTGMLNAIQRFFAYHMIETYGCDYSTSGLSFDTVQTKLKSFMELRTVDGPRHDTYILYYSGHSHSSGEWALAGGDTLRLETVLDWWMEKNSSFCSRLLIVLDCEHPMSWVKEVRKVSNQYIAVQGAEMAKFVDVEETDPPQLGDFTKEWVEYNCNPDHNISWSEKGRTVRAVYGVSKCWSDYSLHLPTESDVAKHWVTYFPRVTYPVVHLANWCGGLNLFWMCKVCFKCFRRFKMSWFPPAVLDTGHGFKLVRS